MKGSIFALPALAAAYYNATTVVTDVDVITTYCSTPTTLTWEGNTVTVTGAKTLTLTKAHESAAPVETGAASTTTTVVTALTTYCPYPTTIVTNGGTYTVSEATTLTITNCPCTLTHTLTGEKPAAAPSTAAPALASETTAAAIANGVPKAAVAAGAAVAGAAALFI